MNADADPAGLLGAAADAGIDAFVTNVLRAIALADCRHGTDIYPDVLAAFSPSEQADIDAAANRHAARRRAAGEPGW